LLLGVVKQSWRPAPEESVKKLSFNDTIQPILSENCYACHGPDPGGRKAGPAAGPEENLLSRLIKMLTRSMSRQFIPGNPDQKPTGPPDIENKNAKDRMPPPEAHKTLKPEQIALLRVKRSE